MTAPGQQPVSFAYLCDRADSVIALTGSSGAVVATYAYDPWGAPTSQPASGIGARNPLRYRGYYYGVATALYYLPARYYDPAVARFLSPDPAAPSAGDPLSLNRYAYCVGDPVNADDPTDVWDMRYHRSKSSRTRFQRRQWGAKAKMSFYSSTGNPGGWHAANTELKAILREGEFGPGSVSLARVVGEDFSDVNVTARHVTGGVMSSYTRYDDGAVITRRYLYLGGSSPAVFGASRLAGSGAVSPGFYGEVGRTIGCTGGAGYLGSSSGLQSGLSTPSGLAGSTYHVAPIVIDEHIDGHQGNTSYGGEYLY